MVQGFTTALIWPMISYFFASLLNFCIFHRLYQFGDRKRGAVWTKHSFFYLTRTTVNSYIELWLGKRKNKQKKGG